MRIPPPPSENQAFRNFYTSLPEPVDPLTGIKVAAFAWGESLKIPRDALVLMVLINALELPTEELLARLGAASVSFGRAVGNYVLHWRGLQLADIALPMNATFNADSEFLRIWYFEELPHPENFQKIYQPKRYFDIF